MKADHADLPDNDHIEPQKYAATGLRMDAEENEIDIMMFEKKAPEESDTEENKSRKTQRDAWKYRTICVLQQRRFFLHRQEHASDL